MYEMLMDQVTFYQTTKAVYPTVLHGWLGNSSLSSMKYHPLKEAGEAGTWCTPGVGQNQESHMHAMNTVWMIAVVQTQMVEPPLMYTATTSEPGSRNEYKNIRGRVKNEREKLIFVEPIAKLA